MPLEEARDGEGVVVLPPGAQRQRPESPQDEPGVDRVQDGAEELQRAPGTADELRAAHDDAGRNVGMAGEGFGRRVKDDVDPEADRILVDGGREGVVRGRADPVLARDPRHGRQIGD
jgi:hypothetical protein